MPSFVYSYILRKRFFFLRIWELLSIFVGNITTEVRTAAKYYEDFTKTREVNVLIR